MCEICKQTPCLSMCPNYAPQKTHCYCSVCNYGSLPGEQYIKNDFDEYAHIDCVNTTKDILNFLKYEINTMGGIRYE